MPKAGVTEARVDAVEKNVGELRGDLAAIHKKVDVGFAEFGRELRTAVATLTAQIGGQAQTRWTPLIAALTLAFTALAFVGKQALDPVAERVRVIEARQLVVERRALDEKAREIERLRDDLRARLAK